MNSITIATRKRDLILEWSAILEYTLIEQDLPFVKPRIRSMEYVYRLFKIVREQLPHKIEEVTDLMYPAIVNI